MIVIKRYSSNLREIWNDFIRKSKNGTFLFDRNYMEYHSDRFEDFSLLFYLDEELLCVLPASVNQGVITSHGGLTYGGFILSNRTSVYHLLQIFEELLPYLKGEKLQRFIYKAIPYVYYKTPSQEDLYVLFRNNAMLWKRDLSSVIDFSNLLSYTKGTKYNLSKARKSQLTIKESGDFDTFMKIEEELLLKKYKAKPTHTRNEIQALAHLFPVNIKLYLVYKQSVCLGGTILYIANSVVHTQYIGITDEGKKLGALDYLMDYLFSQYKETHKYFSFGISTEENGHVLNQGLVRNKESFGARAVTNDFYYILL